MTGWVWGFLAGAATELAREGAVAFARGWRIGWRRGRHHPLYDAQPLPEPVLTFHHERQPDGTMRPVLDDPGALDPHINRRRGGAQ